MNHALSCPACGRVVTVEPAVVRAGASAIAEWARSQAGCVVSTDENGVLRIECAACTGHRSLDDYSPTERTPLPSAADLERARAEREPHADPCGDDR